MKTASLSRNITPKFSQSSGKKKELSKKMKDRERRWTTGLEKGQLKLPKDERTYSSDDSSMTRSKGPSTLSLSSWNSTYSDLDNSESPAGLRTPTPTSWSFSQPDVVQELMQMNKQFLPAHVTNHQYQLSYEMAVDTSPLSPSHYGPSAQQVTYCYHVIHELTTTERRYIHDLIDIIEGYYQPLSSNVGTLPITDDDITQLFGNLQEIRDIQQKLLDDLEESNRDYQKIGLSFIARAEDFKSYTEYCNNYPKSIETFCKMCSNPEISWFLKLCQQKLNHLLPLGAYLLKPVQRVLKYALLLEDLVRHMNPMDKGHTEMKKAVDVMTQVAEHINDMKKRYDDTVRVQELQNLLHGWEGEDLTKYGEIVLEDTLRVVYSKSGTFKPSQSAFRSTREMYVFLFRKMLLITKKKEEVYQYKHHTEMKDMQLTEHLKDDCWFQIRQISSKSTLTFQARSPETRAEWAETIKDLLMDSIPHLPDKAKLLILAGFPTDLSFDFHMIGNTTPKLGIASRTLQRDISPTRPYLPLNSKTLPRSPMLHKNRPTAKAPVKATKSLIQASLTGLAFGSSAPNHKSPLADRMQRDSGFSETPSEDLKKGRRLRFQSLPVTRPSFSRSESDPNLVEESRPSSEESDNGSSDPHSSPPSGQINETRTSSSSHQLEVTQGVRNSISSPDLKCPDDLQDDEMFAESSKPCKPQNQLSTEDNMFDQSTPTHKYSDMHLESNGYDLELDQGSRPLSPDSTVDSSELNFFVGEDPDIFSASSAHMRSKSAPLSSQIPKLATILSCENSPRGSLSNDKNSPSSLVPANTYEEELSPTPSPVLIMQSMKTDDDEVIEIKPSLKLPKRKTESVLSPPSTFAKIDSSTMPFSDSSHTDADHNSSRHEIELMFESLMSGQTDLHSQEIPVPECDKTALEELLNQPTENEELNNEVIPGTSSLFAVPEIMVDSASLKTNSGPTVYDESVKSCLSVGISGSSAGEETPSNMGATPIHTPPPQFRYSRPTTPYTSIEDIPCEVDKDDGEANEDNLIIANRGLFEQNSDFEFDDVKSGDQPSPTDTGVKRWNSFQYRSRKEPPKERRSFTNVNRIRKLSQPTKGSENVGRPGFLRRDHSFKDRHPVNQRPISIIGLVHSTRDDSDLLDLQDAIRRSRHISENVKVDRTLNPQLLHNSTTSKNNTSDISYPLVKGLSAPSISLNALATTVSSNTPSYLNLHGTGVCGEQGNPVQKKVQHKKSSSGRKNRWSLLRSFNHRKERHAKEDSISDDDSRGNSLSEACAKAETLPTTPRRRSDRLPDGSDVGGWRSGGSHRQMTDETEYECRESSPTPNVELKQKRLSNVQAMAREYSMRIKEKPARYSPVDEEEVGKSPSPQPSLTSETYSISSAPGWLINSIDKRRRATTMSGNRMTVDNNLLDVQLSVSQPVTPEPYSPTTSGSKSLTPTIEIHTPSSADTVKTFHFGERTHLTDSSQQNSEIRMKRYPSDDLLVKSIESVKHPAEGSGKRKRPGWVQYLVRKFNSPK